MSIIVVVNQRDDFKSDNPEIEKVTAAEYLTLPRFYEMKDAQVFNLCRSFVYQSDGYYISLLAEARGHHIIPDITTIQDSKTQSVMRIFSAEIDEILQSSFSFVQEDTFEMEIIFGKTTEPNFQKLAGRIFMRFPAPILHAAFKKKHDRWRIHDVDPVSVKELKPESREMIPKFADEYLKSNRTPFKRGTIESKYQLAILVNPEEVEPPSNKLAIKKFMNAAEQVGLQPTIITRDDNSRIAEYDGLFIRETTLVNHHTYRIARRAALKGLVVIDDPDSIVKCGNKVYLAELLERNNIPAPKTMVISKDNAEAIGSKFHYPVILKLPDSCSSQGVKKADDEKELKEILTDMFKKSDLIIAQEYLFTDFDWRVGVLDGKPLYVSKYFMARGHWQITDWANSEEHRHGAHETIPVEEAPAVVVETAIKAANLIGDGLYGVDLKEIDGNCYVIEVNDNPSIDAGVEDEVMKDQLYLRIMEVFLERIKKYNAE